MSIQKMFSDKIEAKKELLKSMNKTKKTKPRALGLICSHMELNQDLLEGISFLEADFITVKSELKSDNTYVLEEESISKNLAGFDFFLCDGETEKLQDLLKKGIVPVIYKENSLSVLLNEFNPMKGEGNCFLYQEKNKWSIYAALVKYLENFKFPYDNKNLVKNVVEI